jgi:hypothetical protein
MDLDHAPAHHEGKTSKQSSAIAEFRGYHPSRKTNRDSGSKIGSQQKTHPAVVDTVGPEQGSKRADAFELHPHHAARKEE